MSVLYLDMTVSVANHVNCGGFHPCFPPMVSPVLLPVLLGVKRCTTAKVSVVSKAPVNISFVDVSSAHVALTEFLRRDPITALA